MKNHIYERFIIILWKYENIFNIRVLIIFATTNSIGKSYFFTPKLFTVKLQTWYYTFYNSVSVILHSTTAIPDGINVVGSEGYGVLFYFYFYLYIYWILYLDFVLCYQKRKGKDKNLKIHTFPFLRPSQFVFLNFLHISTQFPEMRLFPHYKPKVVYHSSWCLIQF